VCFRGSPLFRLTELNSRLIFQKIQDFFHSGDHRLEIQKPKNTEKRRRAERAAREESLFLLLLEELAQSRATRHDGFKLCDNVVVLINCTVFFERLMLANVVVQLISWEANTQIACYCEPINDIEERRAPCFVCLVFFYFRNYLQVIKLTFQEINRYVLSLSFNSLFNIFLIVVCNI
jgi:hypothetical protein